jgi:cytochrome c biogenesis protein
MMRKGDVVVSLAGYKKYYYTGLQVSNDPGVWVVYTGFVAMIIGIYISFLMSHQRICIEVTKNGEKSSVMVAGTANKNKMGMENKIRKMAKKLAHLDQRA